SWSSRCTRAPPPCRLLPRCSGLAPAPHRPATASSFFHPAQRLSTARFPVPHAYLVLLQAYSSQPPSLNRDVRTLVLPQGVARISPHSILGRIDLFLRERRLSGNLGLSRVRRQSAKSRHSRL